MPFLGAHLSIAGGHHLTFARLEAVGGKALQIFTRNQRQWRSEPMDPGATALFREHWASCGQPPLAAHDSYLINLAAPDGNVLEKSITALAEELQRTALLGISSLILHPGCHRGAGVQRGLEQLVRSLDAAIEQSKCTETQVLIETTAGQGSSLGASFEEIAFILEKCRHGDRLGVCFDTCHAFCAGYELRTPEGYEKTFEAFDRIIGLERLKFFHLNDSKKPFGSRVDRHEHIGQGQIGLEAFRLLLNDPRFAAHPMVIETPKGKDVSNDRRNLEILRSLLRSAAAGTRAG